MSGQPSAYGGFMSQVAAGERVLNKRGKPVHVNDPCYEFIGAFLDTPDLFSHDMLGGDLIQMTWNAGVSFEAMYLGNKDNKFKTEFLKKAADPNTLFTNLVDMGSVTINKDFLNRVWERGNDKYGTTKPWNWRVNPREISIVVREELEGKKKK